jgi:hypothetical protein
MATLFYGNIVPHARKTYNLLGGYTIMIYISDINQEYHENSFIKD